MNAAAITEFVQRQRRERIAAGLPATITDADTLRLIAALTAAQGGGGRHAA